MNDKTNLGQNGRQIEHPQSTLPLAASSAQQLHLTSVASTTVDSSSSSSSATLRYLTVSHVSQQPVTIVRNVTASSGGSYVTSVTTTPTCGAVPVSSSAETVARQSRPPHATVAMTNPQTPSTTTVSGPHSASTAATAHPTKQFNSRSKLHADRKDQSAASAKLQRCINHRIVRSKILKEKYSEHLMEYYFLEVGSGNILELYQFAKKQKTPAYLAYMRQHAIENKDTLTPVDSSASTTETTTVVTIAATVSKSSSPSLAPSATAVSSLPGAKISSSAPAVPQQSVAPLVTVKEKILPSPPLVAAVAIPILTTPIPVKRVSTAASDLTPTAAVMTTSSPAAPSTPATTTPASNHHQMHMVEKAKQEAYVVQRISDLQKEGIWSERRLPKLQELHRNKAHWDFLLEEMVWLAADFAQERKWKKAAAKKCARMVQKYFQDKTIAANKAEKAHEQHLRRIAGFCAREVRTFWHNVEKLVEYKQNTILEEKRKKALDHQLKFIVDQTEKYSQLLAEGMSKVVTTTITIPTPTGSVKAQEHQEQQQEPHSDDDDFHPASSDHSTDDEETIAMEEATASASELVEDEVAALQRESTMDLDDFLQEHLPAGYLAARDKSISQSPPQAKRPRIARKSDASSSSSSLSSSSSHSFDDADGDSDDDEETIQEQEQLEGKQNHAEELRQLNEENEMSVEELRLKYCGDGDDNLAVEEEAASSSSDTNSEEDEDSHDDDDDDQRQVDASSSDLGLNALLDTSTDERDGKKTEQNNDKIISDVAALAESIQPKGNTLSSTIVSTKIPFLLKLTLREYQHIGLDWLVTMYDRKLNGILADEMGLGKTIQTIALLAHLACEKENWGPHLIVVPTSVMLNWEMECKKWAPAFKILTYYGTQKERKLKRIGWTKPNAFHICITSYKLVLQDHQSFRRKKWRYLILDEAQNIKNFKSQRWQVLLNFQSHHRLLLTGTPLQNNLMELWSLMHFLMPSVFQSHNEFKEWFSNPVTGMIEGNAEYNENIIRRLHKVLRPFLLRRLKCEVEKQMPKKYEHLILCRLSKRQRYLYDDYMSRANTRETLAKGNLLSVIGILMQLRKVCNHPNLFEVRPIVSSFYSERITFDMPHLACTALEYRVWQNICLRALNLDLIALESELSAYQCYRFRQLQVKMQQHQQYQQTTDCMLSDASAPPTPPCRLIMRIRKNHKSSSEGARRSSTLKPKHQMIRQQHHHLQQSGIKVKMKPQQQQQYSVQLVPPAPMKTIPISMAQTTAVPTATSITATTKNNVGSSNAQKSPEKFTGTAFAQLVQTSSGKHILVTSNSNLGANIPVSTTAVPGGHKLTFLSKSVATTSGSSAGNVVTTTHPIGKTFVKLQVPQLTATSTTSTSTGSSTSTPTLVRYEHGSSNSTGHRKSVGVRFIDQLYANQTNNLDVRWANTTSTTRSTLPLNQISTTELEKQLSDRLDLMGRINEIRCSSVPLYGTDLRNVITLRKHNLSPQIFPWTRCHVSHKPQKRVTHTRRFFDLSRTDTETVCRMIPTPVQRINKLQEFTDRFILYIPAVKSYEPQLHVCRPLHGVNQGEILSTQIRRYFSRAADPLHRIASAQTMQFPEPRLIQYDCGKLQTLDVLLRRLKTDGHRALIFTQMTKMLDVLEAFLNYHGYIYLRLDGTTKVDERQLLMERFNGDSRIFVFILSTRSGGIGVNLTGADTVIFYDSDWNPTMDAQAQDRCHRIGQTRDVHIYRLVSERTVEENILKKANQKRLLGDLAIEGGNFTTAYFTNQTSIQDLFDIDKGEDSAERRLNDVVRYSGERKQQLEKGKTQLDRPEIVEQQELTAAATTTTTRSSEESTTLGILENALASCEDQQDVLATRTATAEAVADLAEFDETIPLDELEKGGGAAADNGQPSDAPSRAEQEISNIVKKLQPIERYAMNFIEATESAWSAEQLAAAEREIEQQKQVWEQNRLAAMKEEEERRAREVEEEADLLTFSRQDANNQVWISTNSAELMPMWCPPTPPQQENDVYVDTTLNFLYQTDSVMSDIELPPIYVKKEPKRSRTEAGLGGAVSTDVRRPYKIPRRQIASSGMTAVSAVSNLLHSTGSSQTAGAAVMPNATASTAAAAATMAHHHHHHQQQPQHIQQSPGSSAGGAVAPKSLFHSVTFLKMRRDLKLQKYQRGLMRAAANATTMASSAANLLQIPLPGTTSSATMFVTAATATAASTSAAALKFDGKLYHDWSIHEDTALLKVIRQMRGLQLNFMSPAHTPNWDYIADYINVFSLVHRTGKQCRHRYDTVVGLRENGTAVLMDGTGGGTHPHSQFHQLQQQQQRSSGGNKRKKSPIPPALMVTTSAATAAAAAATNVAVAAAGGTTTTVNTFQMYRQDNNRGMATVINQRCGTLAAIMTRFGAASGGSGATQHRSSTSVVCVRNPKHVALLAECGIDIERPTLPVDIAAKRVERVLKEKKSSLTLEMAAKLKAAAAAASNAAAVPITVASSTSQMVGTPTVVPTSIAGQIVVTMVGAVAATSTPPLLTTPVTLLAPTGGQQQQQQQQQHPQQQQAPGEVVQQQIVTATAHAPHTIAIQMPVSAAGTVTTAGGVNSTTPPRLIIVTDPLRSQRIMAAAAAGNTLHHHHHHHHHHHQQSPNVVSVANLSQAQLQAATQRLIMSANAAAAQQQLTITTPPKTATQTKTITQAQLQLLRQQNAIKQHIRLQSATPPTTVIGQTLKTAPTVAISGGAVGTAVTSGPTIVHLSQSPGAFVRQVAAAKSAMAATTGDGGVGIQVLKKQTVAARAATGGGGGGAVVVAAGVAPTMVTTTLASISPISTVTPSTLSGIQRISATQVSNAQMATLVKSITANSGGVAQTITLPVSAASKLTAAAALKAATPQQIRQLQLQQQHLLAQKKLAAAQKVSIATVGAHQQLSSTGGAATVTAATATAAKSNVVQSVMGTAQQPPPTQLIVGTAKQLQSSGLAVQQFAQVMRNTPITVAPGSVVLTKGGTTSRVIPVSTTTGPTGKQTIQVVGATSQAITSALRSVTTASNLAGLKVHTVTTAPNVVSTVGGGGGQQQATILSHVAFQNQSMRHGSPVRLQTASGASIVAVTMQPAAAANLHAAAVAAAANLQHQQQSSGSGQSTPPPSQQQPPSTITIQQTQQQGAPPPPTTTTATSTTFTDQDNRFTKKH